MTRTLVLGPIFTADREHPWAEAMVVADGVVAFAGTRSNAIQTAGPDAEVVELGDGLVLPGFFDGHAHLLSAGAALRRAVLRPCTTLDEIRTELLRWRAANPDAPRVLGVGWVFSALPDATPTRQMLDEIIDDVPVYLDASDLHSVWCNSAALAELGVTAETADPVGGRIVRDGDDQATGLLLENAGYHLAWPVMNAASAAEDDANLRAAIGAYLAAGTTSAVDMALQPKAVGAIERAAERGELPFTVIGHWLINRTGDPASELAQVHEAAAMAARHTTGPIRIAGIKLITDGTIDGCTAGLIEPHTNGEPGEMVWPREALEPVILAADEAGLQIAAHAIGDLAVRTVLDCLEVAAARRAARGDTRPRRHRIEHLEYVDPTDIPRLAALGVTASMQPVHVDPAYLDNWIELLGPQRAQWGFAWPLYRDSGATLAFGTDTPTAAHHPLPNMYIATTRRSPYVADAEPLRPDFALPLAESVVHATADAAWASFEEDRRGRLLPGQAADFVVLDRNPFVQGPGSLLETRVLATYVAGQRVYEG